MKSETTEPWYRLENEAEVDSPALLVYPERIDANIRRMLEIAGGPEILRPHVKSHKMAEVVRAQMVHGIDKFKCATIAEAEMVAGCGAPDVMLAYQPVGPKIDRLLALVRKFPDIRFSTLVDSPEVLSSISATFASANSTIPLFVDVNVGMNRTGISSLEDAFDLYLALVETPGVEAAGLHIYDGHLHDRNTDRLQQQVAESWSRVEALIDAIKAAKLPDPTLIVGGTPTFPVHAGRREKVGLKIELSPGTSLLWDRGYAVDFPDLPFEPAATLLTRVVSKPSTRTVCLDLGIKAVASEMQPPRVWFPELSGTDCLDLKMVMHNEEHMVLEFDGADRLPIGSCLYAIPWHICPTVALHSEATVVEQGKATGTWKVAARDRRLTV
ncbi:MAG: D-TA family PLP-dependent enzyme [Pirellulales bacterium]